MHGRSVLLASVSGACGAAGAAALKIASNGDLIWRVVSYATYITARAVPLLVSSYRHGPRCGGMHRHLCPLKVRHALQANIGGLLTFTAALRALPAVTAVAASLCGNMLISVGAKPSYLFLVSDFEGNGSRESRHRPSICCDDFKSEATSSPRQASADTSHLPCTGSAGQPAAGRGYHRALAARHLLPAHRPGPDSACDQGRLRSDRSIEGCEGKVDGFTKQNATPADAEAVAHRCTLAYDGSPFEVRLSTYAMLKARLMPFFPHKHPCCWPRLAVLRDTRELPAGVPDSARTLGHADSAGRSRACDPQSHQAASRCKTLLPQTGACSNTCLLLPRL